MDYIGDPGVCDVCRRPFDDEMFFAMRSCLPMRAQVDGAWTQAVPDVFSIRHTSVEVYVELVVGEIKVSRADLLGDLKRPEKRAAYLAMASQV